MNPRALTRFVLARILVGLLLIGVVTCVTFLLLWLAPGSPIDVLLGDYPASAEYRAELEARFGLDRPLHAQLWDYVRGVMRGDLGTSLAHGAPVLGLILARLPATALLMGSAMLLAIVIGIPLGVIASRRPYSLIDNAASVAAVVGYSAPVFWIGQLMIVGFGAWLSIFPVQGMRSVGAAGGIAGVLDVAWHLVLPMLALSFRYMSINARMTRASMIETLEKDFITTARAKGLSPTVITWKHALRNSLIPVLTVVGYNFGFLLTGSVLVETVFGWPGIGTLLYTSIRARDMQVVVGIFLSSTAMAVFANLMTDIAYVIVDPRLRR